LRASEIGFITAGITAVADCRVGDTVTEDRRPASEPLRSFKPIQSVVLCSLVPTDEGGYIEGQNVAIEYAWAQGEYDRLPALAFGPRASVIVTQSAPAAVAAKAATSTIPIVFVLGIDPVKSGLVAASTGLAATSRASRSWRPSW
jgi:hypothetical protein